MGWLAWVIVLLLGAGVVFVLTEIRVDIHFKHVQKDDQMELKISAWHGLLRYRFRVPVLETKEGEPAIIMESESGVEGNKINEETKNLTPADFQKVWSEMRTLLEQFIGLHRILRRFLAHVHLKRLKWHSMIGAGQAAHTGMLVGGCWALKGSIIGILSAYFRVDKRPDCLITPDFNGYKAATVFSCTLTFKLIRAIWTLMILSRHWKNKKTKQEPREIPGNTEQSI